MGSTAWLFPPEFKEEAVQLIHASDMRGRIPKIARDLGIFLLFLQAVATAVISIIVVGLWLVPVLLVGLVWW